MSGHPASTLLAGQHRYHLRTYYDDTDAGGIVYHANYLRYAERARTEALRDLGVPHSEMGRDHGLFFMVRRVKLDYLAPARLDEALVVTTEPLALRAASVELRQTVTRGDTRLVVIEIQLASVRIADGRPGRIPPRWREALLRLGAGQQEG